MIVIITGLNGYNNTGTALTGLMITNILTHTMLITIGLNG